MQRPEDLQYAIVLPIHHKVHRNSSELPTRSKTGSGAINWEAINLSGAKLIELRLVSPHAHDVVADGESGLGGATATVLRHDDVTIGHGDIIAICEGERTELRGSLCRSEVGLADNEGTVGWMAVSIRPIQIRCDDLLY
jgi:hypothetical protein